MEECCSLFWQVTEVLPFQNTSYVHADFTRCCWACNTKARSEFDQTLLPTWKSGPRDCMLYYWLYLRHSAIIPSSLDNIARNRFPCSLTARLSSGRSQQQSALWSQQKYNVRLEGHSSSGWYTQLHIRTCTAQVNNLNSACLNIELGINRMCSEKVGLL